MKSTGGRVPFVPPIKVAADKAAVGVNVEAIGDKVAVNEKVNDGINVEAIGDRVAVNEDVILVPAIGDEVLYPCPVCKKNKVSVVHFPCAHAWLTCQPGCYLIENWTCHCGAPITHKIVG
jgi:hypothetical protein